MKVVVAAEFIMTEETHEEYFLVWILQCMVKINPRFQLSNICIIFADQNITPTVHKVLGIESACTLCWDFCHLLHEIWPNQIHSSIYPQIQKLLHTMLLSSTKIKWERAYLWCASEIIKTKPCMMGALNDINGNPEKYGVFYLVCSIEGNFKMNGDVSLEQNHSGVVTYLGEGACFAVAEQITHLLRRQKNINKIWRQKEEDDQYIQEMRLESSYFGSQQQADDTVAKKTFSGYGFKLFWTRTIRNSWNVQCERN
jgi:hypothetical protein